MPPGPEPLPAANLLEMGDPSAQSGILGDVLGPQSGVTWRWTNQHPRFRVWFDPTRRWDFVARFTVPGAVLNAVGPLTLRFLVNGRELEVRKFDKDQDYAVSKPVPAEILAGAETATLGFDVDPVLVSKGDGVKLGVLIQEIGLAPSPQP